MDFNSFAQLLFPFCGDGQKKSDFVTTLIDNIMEEPSNETDKVKAANGEYNPLSALQADALNRIYNGSRRITSQNASAILGRLDKDRFIDYISGFTTDALKSLCSTLNEHNISATHFDVGKTCAELLEETLMLCATDNKKRPTPDIIAKSRLYTEVGIISDVIKPIARKTHASINLSGFFESHVPAKEFINRETPRNVFYDLLDSNPPFSQNVIMYYGIGGIGKSSLIKNLKEYTTQKEVRYSSVDFDEPDLRSTYKALISLEKKIGTTFPHFDIAVTLCFIKRNPEFSFHDIGLPNKTSQKILELLQSSNDVARYNPTSGLIAQIYDEYAECFDLDKAIQEQLAALEERSAADIEDQLPIFFAVDLYRHMMIEGLEKFVLFFDTHELLWEKGRGEENKLRNDAWIRMMAGMGIVGGQDI